MTTNVDTAVKSSTAQTSAASGTAPVIIDLGKKPRRQVRKMRDGSGKLMDKVNTMLDELREDGTISRAAQPVLIIVRQRPRKKGMGWAFR